jgi:hypothetical protein
MPTPDADDIADKAANVANDGIASMTSDGQSATSLDPEKLLNVSDRLANKSAAVGTTRGLLFTKLSPPGAS